MNICLIYPVVKEDMGNWPSLGLAYIAAVLEQEGHFVKIIDRNVLSRKKQNVNGITSDIIKKIKPEIVGITATTPIISDAMYSTDLVKSSCPNTKVILGGHHPTILFNDVLKNENVDIIVLGEGEISMCGIAKGKELKDIPGIAYKEGKKIFFNGVRNPIFDIDTLPLPAWHLLDMEYYIDCSKNYNPVIRGVNLRATHIFTARGCPYKCAFCAGSVIFGNKVRFHSIDYIIRGIEYLIDNYNIQGIYFAEDMFLSQKERVKTLCNEFIRRKINKKIVWCAQCRSDSVDKELLSMMKNAGCIQVEYGFESGSQRILNFMNKKTSVEQNIWAADLTKEVGLRFLADIIVGFPGETEEDFVQTIKFIKKIKPTEIGFNVFTPLPGTKAYNDLINQKIISTPNWSDFYVASRKLNFTTMSNCTFFDLYDNFMETFVNPNRVKNYYIYNISHYPLTTLNNLMQRTKKDPLGTIKKIWFHSSKCIMRKIKGNKIIKEN